MSDLQLKIHFLMKIDDLRAILYTPYYPYIEWKGGGGQIWPLLKIDFQDPENGPKCHSSEFWAKQKLLEIKFWVILI